MGGEVGGGEVQALSQVLPTESCGASQVNQGLCGLTFCLGTGVPRHRDGVVDRTSVLLISLCSNVRGACVSVCVIKLLLQDSEHASCLRTRITLTARSK